MKQTLCATLALLMLSGCAVGPDYSFPTFETKEWIEQPQSNEATMTDWWRVFDDPILSGLVAKVGKDNLDIEIARARIAEARALRGVARSPLLPSIGVSSAFTRNKQSLNNPQFIQAPGIDIPQIQNTYDAGFDASWEIDLFGGNRRALEAATARLEGTEALRNNVILSVVAETARNYIELRGNQKRAALLKRNAELQQQTVDLVKASFESGLSREIDVTRADAQLANTQALIPNLEAEIRAGSYRLAVLTAQQPGELFSLLEQNKPLPAPREVVPLGLQSDLLRRRPDIQIAERNLAASNADVGVAVAELYPSFNLTGSIGFLAASSGNLFESASESFLLSPFINFPIFEGGRLRAQIDAAEARNSIAATQYEQTVLRALEETESSLIRYAKEQETREKLEQAVSASKRSAQLSNILYEKGLTDFIDVLEAERALTSTQDALVQSETRALTNLTALYKSLGGGWELFAEKKQAGNQNAETSITELE